MKKTIRTLLAASFLFLSLAQATTLAHALELPQKIHLPIPLYAKINQQLYKYFAILGGSFAMLSLFCSMALCVSLKENRRWFLYALLSTLCQLNWLLSWLLVVQPVNRKVGEAIAGGLGTERIWEQERFRWELGHLAGWLFHLGALLLLLTMMYHLLGKVHEPDQE